MGPTARQTFSEFYEQSKLIFQDVDECGDTNLCSDFAQCADVQGAYRCQCLTGYEGDGISCFDIDECQDSKLHQCGDKSYCTNNQVPLSMLSFYFQRDREVSFATATTDILTTI